MIHSIPVLKDTLSKDIALQQIRETIVSWNYSDLIEVNETKPWGAYYRFQAGDARRFVEEFFPGLLYEEACLGDVSIELSPKILVVSPRQRLSWQYHHRRAERWRFLTPGVYHRSTTDDEGGVIRATAGDAVQFLSGERHRLCALDQYVIVAEIWQHIDKTQLSDEEDIIRLADDYSR